MSKKDPTLEFIDRVFPVLAELDGGFASLKTAAVKKMSSLILKYGDLMQRKPPELMDIPRAVKQALQGDEKSGYALAVLANNIVGGMFAFNTIIAPAVIIGGDASRGIEELSNVYAGPSASELGRTLWYRTIYANVLHSLNFGPLWLIMRSYFIRRLPSNPYYHIENVLRSILLDLEITRSTRSVPFDLEYPYDFFVAKTPQLSREVDGVINNKEQYGLSYYFRTTRVEPRALLLSLVLYYCYSNKSYYLSSHPFGSNQILQIELDADLIRETWKNYRPHYVDMVLEYVKELAPIMSPTHPNYIAFTCLKPYADFFEAIEGVMEGKLGDEKAVNEGLMKTAVPFLNRFYPFIRPSPDGKAIIIEGESKPQLLNLLGPLAITSSLSATCAVQLLSGLHAWKRLTKASRSTLSSVLKRARTASFDPFLAPEVLIRHTFLAADAMLFKITNALFEAAGMSDFVFEPTGNLEEDLSRMWEMLPDNSRAALKVGLDRLKGFLAKEREPYDLFVRIQKTPLEWCSVHIAEVFLEIERGTGR
jgi:hypothetical protein